MYKKIAFLLIVFFYCSFLSAQNTGEADQHAERIAQRMKDTLSLSEAQKVQLVSINKQLTAKKVTAWKSGKGTFFIQSELQKVENTRDSLYRTVLPEDKFLLYQEKKETLVSSN